MKQTFLLLTLTFTITAQAQTAFEAWARRYNNTTDSYDEASVVKTDNAGNVIVAGYTYEGTSGADLLLIKYSNTGAPLWTNRYDGPAHREDRPSALAVDASNNVIVTMGSVGTSGDDEFATIKYSSAGVPLWTNRYHGPSSGGDYIYGVAVDATGNVFVTGESEGIGSGLDYATIKYSSSGVALWTNRYNGPGNEDDYPWGGLAVDASGNVFVTGTSSSGGSFDSTTIGYSSAGTPLWVNRYKAGDSDSEANAIAVAGTNVFVTGGSYGVSFDYVTIAYSVAGVALWTNYYNGSANSSDSAVAIVASGSNLFVTGRSYGSGTDGDYVTIAYSIAGLPLWTNRYNGPLNSYDTATAISVDTSGNVFVTGSSPGAGTSQDYATVAYTSSGSVLWIQRYNGPGNGIDSSRSVTTDTVGNVFVTGASPSVTSSDWTTIKYLASGLGSWTNRYNGVGKGSGGVSAIAVDGSGNVIVTGNISGSGGGEDYATVKYSSTGIALWTNRYNGYGNLSDYAYGVGTDTDGNVYVTGVSPGLGTESDYATIKYSSTGVGLWTNRYNGPNNYTDEAVALGVDGTGSVIVTGYSDSGSSVDYATLKYSSAGVPLWTNQYDGPASSYDKANALTLDASGNAIVTGISVSGTSYDYATIKYSSAGVPLWTNLYDGPGQSYDEALAVVTDGSGNVIVTGYSDSGTSADYATVKYSSAGVPLWTNRYDAAGNFEEARAVAADTSGNVYVTGYSESVASSDYVTIKYSSSGTPLWTNRYGGSVAGDEKSQAVVVDASGNVFVTGYSQGSGTGADFATIAYASAGTPLWTNRYDGPLSGNDGPFTSRSIAVLNVGSIVVGGSSSAGYAGGSGSDFFTLKYVTFPSLDIRRTTTNTVAVSWPSPSTGFRLQQNTNGIATVNWSNVTTAPNDNGTNKTFIVNPPTGNRFYRLIYP